MVRKPRPETMLSFKPMVIPLRTLVKEQARAWFAYQVTSARVHLYNHRHFRIQDARHILRWGSYTPATHRALVKLLKQAGYRFNQKTRSWSLPE